MELLQGISTNVSQTILDVAGLMSPSVAETIGQMGNNV